MKRLSLVLFNLALVVVATVFSMNNFGLSHSLNFEGRVVRVLPREISAERNDVCLELRSSKDDAVYYVDDFFIIFIIEQTYKVLLSDYIKQDVEAVNINLKLEKITVRDRLINNKKVKYIVNVGKIFPRFPHSKQAYDYHEINPGVPEQDFYHRYIEVPLSYKDPARGTFKLYYELCSDFDVNKPTILIPTDGQRSLSQVGWADKYKKMFDLDYNTVTYEYRGMFCSKIKELGSKNIDWALAYEFLNSDNVVEDIESIRKDLLGEKQINILGGSGTAMIGLKYISKYPEKVRRAFLMSFFKDAQGSSEAGVMFFNNFLEKNNLREQYDRVLQNPRIEKTQLLFLIQRLLYFDQEEVKQLIIELDNNNLSRYHKYTRELGHVNFFVRSVQKYKPWTVVFMYETNLRTSQADLPDINYPFLRMAEPLIEIYGNSPARNAHLFDIQNLKNINTEILLVGGLLDQVAPITELERIHRELPNSKLAIFEAYHCLEAPPEARKTRNKLANLFFIYGHNSKEFLDYLTSSSSFRSLASTNTPF
ncbi:MAG: alpha/beta fold hydrolase [Candidatus Aminicenantes bacterium]|nr:alpha/beta fold hydrolase [Candidatus Aminicenantes bacterium]